MCLPTMWTTGNLELESSLGPGLACRYGCRHLVLVFSQPLSLWKLANTSKLISASDSVPWGTERIGPSVMSSAFCGVGKAQLSPTLRYGRAGNPLVSQELQAFFSSWTQWVNGNRVHKDFQMSSEEFVHENLNPWQTAHNSWYFPSL